MSAVFAFECAQYAPAPDRSLGSEGRVLRTRLAEAVAVPAPRDEEVYERMFAALARAYRNDQLTVSHAAFERATQFLLSLPGAVPLPDVVVETDSAIGLDWDAATNRVLSVTVDESSRVGYSALIGLDSHHGRLDFAEGTPRVPTLLRQFLSQIYPHV